MNPVRQAALRAHSLVLGVLKRVRFAMYTLVGLIPFSANLMTTIILLHTSDMNAETISRISFIVGGQVSFWAHDRITFGNQALELKGWLTRLIVFMGGQGLGFVVNFIATSLLVNLHAWDPLVIAGGFAGIIPAYLWNRRFYKYIYSKSSDEPQAPPSVESL